MPPTHLSTQEHFRPLKRLNFCYACGGPFTEADPSTDEHVFAKSLFAPEHRSPVLILPAHLRCNNKYSVWDGQMAEFFSLHNGRDVDERRRQLRIVFPSDGVDTRLSVLQNVPLDQVIIRWVRGLHAALYRTYQPHDEQANLFMVSGPAHRGSTGHMGENIIDPVQVAHRRLSQKLRSQRAMANFDSISLFGGQCNYYCLWSNMDDGRPCCIFALRIYNWELIGETDRLPKIGCLGLYVSARGRPATAAAENRIDTRHIAYETLDPFGR